MLQYCCHNVAQGITYVALKKGHRVRKARGKTRGNSIPPYYYMAILDKHCSNLAPPLFVGAQCFFVIFLIIFRIDLLGAEIIFRIFF